MAKSKKENIKNGESNLVTQSEFARIVGVSRQLIFKLTKDDTSKRIQTVKKDGLVLIDKEKSLKLWYENKDLDKDIGRTFASVVNEAKNHLENKNKDKKANIKNKYSKKEESRTNSKNKEDEYSEKDLTVKELVRLKILADVQKKALELEIMRGDLISKQKVENILPSLLISFSAQIKMLPSRNAEQIASKLKSKYSVNINESEIAEIIRETIEKDVIEMINILRREAIYED